ncbi:MAG: endonuclease/exonuclease/phosphatase family protein [Myxococcota bacterium]
MRFPTLCVTTLLLTLACGSDNDPVELRVETYNLGLAGAFVPNEAVRRGPVIEAVANLDADIVCLQEVWEQSDKDALLAATAANFPHSLTHTTDLQTPISSPEDQNGDVPPIAGVPPCMAFPEELGGAVYCLSENCSTMPGSEEGQTTGTDCAASNCVAPVGALLFGDQAAQQCYACLTTALPTESFAGMRNLCTSENDATLAFRGQSSSVILSKYPLSNGENYVLPGTWNRRVITVATATLPGGTEVDVYCNHLTPIFGGLTFPYTGAYGNGMSGSDGWAAEQLLQTDKLIALVEARSGDRPALILGDMNAGRADLGPDLLDEGAATYDRLASAFTLGVAADYTGLCTFCGGNQNTSPETGDVWIDHIFLSGIEASDVLATERTFDEATVMSADGLVAPSDHYGLRSTIVIR